MKNKKTNLTHADIRAVRIVTTLVDYLYSKHRSSANDEVHIRNIDLSELRTGNKVRVEARVQVPCFGDSLNTFLIEFSMTRWSDREWRVVDPDYVITVTIADTVLRLVTTTTDGGFEFTGSDPECNEREKDLIVSLQQNQLFK